MNDAGKTRPMTRRQWLQMIGMAAGSGVAYRAMAQLAVSDPSPPVSRIPGASRARPGASVLVLGGGVAGLSAAIELSRIGYAVTVLEYNKRPGGRCWTIRGGDSIEELGGETQHCRFEEGLYLNPGPWRIPYDHRNLLSYIHELGVPLEHQVQGSHNTLLHSAKAFGGRPQRLGAVRAAFAGHVSELLAKSSRQGALDQLVSAEDQEKLLEALREWGELGPDHSWKGHSDGLLLPTRPISRADLLRSGFWRSLGENDGYHDVMMQPVGGMDRVAWAMYEAVKPLVRLNARVVSIRQDERRVSVTYVDADSGANPQTLSADWCVCALPLTVLGQMKEVQVGAPMAAGIRGVAYAAALKVGLQFRRRFWEEDERIYGGITYTDLPIRQISYPSDRLGTKGRGVLLGAYVFGALPAFEFTSLSPAERVKWTVKFGAQIHPQYLDEFENGVGVGWHRMPWIMGCAARWSESLRAQHFENLRAIDGRIVLAGDHLSNLTAWQEGALVSSLDAVARLHQKALATS